MELGSVLGTLLGILAVVGGQLLEGGSLGQLIQPAAACIVGLGTLAAVLVSFPLDDLQRAWVRIPRIYSGVGSSSGELIVEIIEVAHLARKEGILAIEARRSALRDPVLRRTLKYVVDGFEPAAVREILDAEIGLVLDAEERAAQVFETAGGYAPTVGIIGAVLGLIHVMAKLNEPERIGEGIAVAFVATIYGVALANLILLPWGSRLKALAQAEVLGKELVKSGVIGILEGANPFILQEKLEILAGKHDAPVESAPAAAGGAA